MKKAIFIGGDMRMIHAAEYMSDCCECSLMGFDTIGGSAIPNAYETGRIYDIAVLPVFRGGVKEIRCPDSNRSFDINVLRLLLKQDGLVLTGSVFPELEKLCEESDFSLYCYTDREEFAVRNAVLTAEGALELAIKNTPFSIHGSNVLVSGFGRIGKLCARYFSELGAVVTAAARKKGDIAAIAAYGFIPTDFNDEDELISSIAKADLIINTVPAKILTGKRAEAVKRGALLIELASVACTDKDKHLKIISAGGLPGKTAPITAGKIIAQTAKNILTERSEKNGGA